MMAASDWISPALLTSSSRRSRAEADEDMEEEKKRSIKVPDCVIDTTLPLPPYF
jgi:hypothetical protein